MKHLEFIQNVISRHNSNSFKIKGWSITITSAIFALTASINEPYICFIALGPILMFWILDSTFVANERCFTSLYSAVANNYKLIVEKNNLQNKIQNILEEDFKEYCVKPFSMNFVQFREIKRNNWSYVFFSYTFRLFYPALTILTIITFFSIKAIENKEIQSSNKNSKIECVNKNTAIKIIKKDTL